MDKIKISLKHCRGIKKFDTLIDFSKGNMVSIYAQNGTMKTSFAKTFSDFVKRSKPEDKVYPENESKMMVTVQNESNRELKPEEVFVIRSMNTEYSSEEPTTLLMIENSLRKEYQKISKELDKLCEILFERLKKPLGISVDNIEEEFVRLFTGEHGDLFQAIEQVNIMINQELPRTFPNVVYKHIKNEQVLNLLKEKGFQDSIKNYIEKYDAMVEQSVFFKKGIFDHLNASSVTKNLKDNNYFKAKNSLNIDMKGENKRITTIEDLENLIREEKERILTSTPLKEAFEEVDKKVTKNKQNKQLLKYLKENRDIILELNDPNSFRKKLWIGYILEARDSFEALLLYYNSNKNRTEEIIEKAKKQNTKWIEVVEIFKKRFSVPFRIEVGNQKDVILKKHAPVFKFFFVDEDTGEEKEIKRGSLVEVLSHGETRALYLMNIIFEIKSMQEDDKKGEFLIIIDDIADSFDYKNKYAIMEYLQEIKSEERFKIIVLTHNYDFHRTLTNRLNLNNRFIARREDGGEISLNGDKYSKGSPFHYWKQKLKDRSRKHLIASIPFIRELAKLANNKPNRLNCAIHEKPESNEFKVSDLEEIIKEVLNDQDVNYPEKNKLVKDIIFEETETILESPQNDSNLEDKIILSIAIRLKAEMYMLNKINDPEFKSSSNQTRELRSLYVRKFPKDKRPLGIIDKVLLMTSENIHLNAFMYEPIIDISSSHLIKLYKELENIST